MIVKGSNVVLSQGCMWCEVSNSRRGASVQRLAARRPHPEGTPGGPKPVPLQ